MDSAMENTTEIESEIVEQGTDKVIECEELSNVVETDKETETGEETQDTVMETENKNPGEIVGEEDPVSEHKDSHSTMITKEGDSILEKGANDDDLSKIDDDKKSQLETRPATPLVGIDPEEGFIKPTVEDKNIECSEVSAGFLKNDRDSVMVYKDTAVVHEVTTTVPHSKFEEEKGSPNHMADTLMDQDKAAEEHDVAYSEDRNESTVTPNTKLSEDKGSPLHHADTVTEQEKAVEEHDMPSSGDQNEITVTPDTKLSEHKGSPRHHADTVMEQEKAAEEPHMISSGDQNEITVATDTKVFEENDDRIDKGDANNMSLADHGSESVYHDQRATKEDEKEPDEPGFENLSDLEYKPSELLIETSMYVEKRPEVPGSEIESNLENKPFEPLAETLVNIEKEPDMPATENLSESHQNSDVLAAVVSGDSDKGLSFLPATKASPNHNEGVAKLEAERMEEMELDDPDSKLVTDASIDPTNNNDMNLEAPTSAENKDYSIVLVPEGSDADNENASVRREPGPPCVASSDIKSEVGVTGGLDNGVHKKGPPSPCSDRPMSPKRSFLLDDTSEGYESGTEEDQSAFMKELYHFFRERKMDFRPPKFYGEGLNCLKLWRAVIRLGGYDKVTGCKLWRQVGESFRPPKTCTTVSWTFRGFYEKALLEYERHRVLSGEIQIPLAIEPGPMSVDNQASGSGRARRDAAARAMQGWHSQRLNGNGEVNDPAIKDKNLVPHQKREKQIGTSPGLLKRKRLSSTEHFAKHAIQVSNPMLDVTVVDVGPPADWVKINVQRTQDCFEVYALVPGLVREEVRVQSDPAGRLVISGEPENPMNPWGATPFKKVVSLPTRIDPHHTSAVVTLNGQLFVRVPLEQSD